MSNNDLTPNEAALREQIRLYRTDALVGEEAAAIKPLVGLLDEMAREQPILEREAAQRAAEHAARERLLQRQHELRLAQIAFEAEQRAAERQAAVRKS